MLCNLYWVAWSRTIQLPSNSCLEVVTVQCYNKDAVTESTDDTLYVDIGWSVNTSSRNTETRQLIFQQGPGCSKRHLAVVSEYRIHTWRELREVDGKWPLSHLRSERSLCTDTLDDVRFPLATSIYGVNNRRCPIKITFGAQLTQSLALLLFSWPQATVVPSFSCQN
jgi:hypothetical protein